MSRRKFTDEEISQMASNPYTSRVSRGQIRFTWEFKRRFWNDYCSGMSPRQILRACGYSVEVLGEERIEGIQYSIKKEAFDTDGFTKEPWVYGVEKDEEAIRPVSPQKRICQLEQRVQYLEQQIEFLKKISSIRNTKK